MTEHGILAAVLPLPLTLAAATIDIRRRIIPDGINLGLLLLGLAFSAWSAIESPVSAAGLASAVVPASAAGLALLQAGVAFVALAALQASYRKLRGRPGLGTGDVKFVAAGTALVGLAGLPTMVLVASLSGLIFVAGCALAGRPVGLGTRLPFAPFLALGLHLAALFTP